MKLYDYASIHDQQQNIDPSSRRLNIKVKMADCIKLENKTFQLFTCVYYFGIFASFYLVKI